MPDQPETAGKHLLRVDMRSAAHPQNTLMTRKAAASAQQLRRTVHRRFEELVTILDDR